MRLMLMAMILFASPMFAADPVAAAKDLAKDAKAVAGAAKATVDSAVEKAEGAVHKAEAVAQSAPIDVLKESVRGHWHNKLVHFPVALGIFGCLFFIAALKWPNYLWPSRVLLGAAVLIGLPSMKTGEMAEELIEGTSLHTTLEWHETSAKVMLGLLLATLILSFFPSFKKWSWLVALAACGAVAFAGALGGALASA